MRGPHCSQRPRATRTTESAVRSRSLKMRVSSRLMPGKPSAAPRSRSRTRSTRDSGTCSSRAPTRSAWGSTTMMASPSRPAAFSSQLVGDEVAHERGLAHARARHVEVVAAQQVVGEADRARPARGRLADVGAAVTPRPEGRSTFAPERSTRGVSSRAPGGCQSAAASRTPRTLRLPKNPGADGCRLAASGSAGRTLLVGEARASGVVVVAVGGGHRRKQLARPLAPLLRLHHRQDGGDLNLGVEGDAGDLLLDQERVVDTVAADRCQRWRSPASERPGHRLCPPPARPSSRSRPPAPTGSHAPRRAPPRRGRPWPAPRSPGCGPGRWGRAGAAPEAGARRPSPGGPAPTPGRVSAAAAAPPRARPRFGRGERAEQGEEGVGAGVEEVVVAEDAQGDVLGAAGAQGHRPRLLPIP